MTLLEAAKLCEDVIALKYLKKNGYYYLDAYLISEGHIKNMCSTRSKTNNYNSLKKQIMEFIKEHEWKYDKVVLLGEAA